VQDEGSYVLSYRYWHSNPYFVSGSQYFYGPVFEALDESIPWLRVLRLVMVIGVNAWFARCFLEWLDRHSPAGLPASRTSLTLLLIASGGMSYLWAPLTPGYYDLTADVALALVALMFLALLRGPRPPWWIPLATGILSVALVITKWTALPVLVPVLLVPLLGFGTGNGARLRYLVQALLGAVLALAIFQLYALPVDTFATTLWRVSRLTAIDNHGVGYLARVAIVSTAVIALGAAVLGAPLWAGLVAARRVGRRRPEVARRWLLGGGILALVLTVVVASGGGATRIWGFLGLVLAALVAAAIGAYLSGRRPIPGGRSGWWVAAVLFLVPVLQTAGSNVPPLYVIVECLAMWVGLVLMLVAHAPPGGLAREAVLVNLGVVVVATAIIAGQSTVASPFKTSPLPDDTTTVPGLGVRLAPAQAKQYAALRTALAPYVVKDTTPVLTLDQLAGLAYLVGGVPAGSTWTDQWTPSRTAGILELACRRGDVPSERPPVLIVDRSVHAAVAAAMARCGFPFPQGYRRLDLPGGPPGVTAWVPTTPS
jgi:hypothetical protein